MRMDVNCLELGSGCTLYNQKHFSSGQRKNTITDMSFGMSRLSYEGARGLDVVFLMGEQQICHGHDLYSFSAEHLHFDFNFFTNLYDFHTTKK